MSSARAKNIPNILWKLCGPIELKNDAMLENLKTLGTPVQDKTDMKN